MADDHTTGADLTVLDSKALAADVTPDREVADHLLFHLLDEMDEQEKMELASDIEVAILDAVMGNLRHHAAEVMYDAAPAELLNAEAVGEMIGEAAYYCINAEAVADPIHSSEIMHVIYEHAEEKGLIERQ